MELLEMSSDKVKMTNLKSRILNLGLRKDLARYVPVLSKLEGFKELSNLRLISVDASDDSDNSMRVTYIADASPEVCRRLKSALIEGGVIGKYTPKTQSCHVFRDAHINLYFFKEGIMAQLIAEPKK